MGRARWAVVVALIWSVVGVPAPAAGSPTGEDEAEAAVQAEAAVARLPATADDEVLVTARADTAGYHVQVARGAEGWAWRELATILPDGADGEPWTGDHCLTGDGRYVVAVVAPRALANDPAGRDRGGLLYRVALANGAVTPLAAGVALKYYNPGCGAGATVAVIRHEGRDQERTRVQLLDVERGRLQAEWSVAGQLTSAVPVAGTASSAAAVAAARDTAVVRLDGRGERTLARTEGVPFHLRASAAGGLDYLVAGADGASEAPQVGIWSLPATGGARHVGDGTLGRTKLFAGADRTVAVDADELDAGSRFAEATAGDGRPVAASSGGAVVAVDVPRADDTGGHGGHGAGAVRHGERQLQNGADGESLGRPEPAPGTGAIAPLPAGLVVAGSGTDGTTSSTSTTGTAAAPGPPKCAVPRNDVRRQAPQPGSAQVDWAIQQATRNLLKGSVLTRSANYVNMQLGAGYQPSSVFPRPALGGAAAGAPIPPSVIQAVFAQESNWKQASWRALPGVSANPLVGDYYGAAGTLDRIDYPNADCGYGVAQVTTPMTMAGTEYTADEKAMVAVDYAANVAAGIEILAAKWNELAIAGIGANNRDPARLENWYMATWAYNTGVNPRDAAGRWGLGWTNNPMNADYPPDRPGFLRETYADAEHPNDWPYQERIFGWMESPQLNHRGQAQYAEPAYASGAATLRLPPRDTFCTPAANACNPAHVDPNPTPPDQSFCTLADRHCWWHAPVTWVPNCASVCATSLFTVSSTATEPAGDDNYPPNCNARPPAPLDGRPHVIVDDAPPGLNAEGCVPSGWTSAGSFTVSHGSSGGAPLGVIDWHQLGTGFSGHTWFTKNRVAGDTAHVNTGTWTPPTLSGRYSIKVHVPPSGASTPSARYAVHNGTGGVTQVVVDQHLHENRWVPLGEFDLAAGAKVVLTNATAETVGGTTNVAFDAVAFTPVPATGRLVDVEFQAAAIFDQAQPTSARSGGLFDPLDNPNASDTVVEQWLLDRIDPILAKPACAAGVRNTSCVGASVLWTLIAFRNQITTTVPAIWQGHANSDPPNPLPAGYLDDPDHHKLHNAVNVRYRLAPDGRIDPASVVVGFTAQSGITHMPQFMPALFDAMRNDYLAPVPDLRYHEENLGSYTHAFSDVDPLATGGGLPGREFRPAITDPEVSGGCVTLHAVGGGMVGWKIALNEGGIAGAVHEWKDLIGDAADDGYLPAQLSTLLDGIYKHWWSNQYSTALPPRYQGAVQRMAPAIWIEQDFKVCGTGQVSPADGSPRIATNSYMPDLYLWVNGQRVNAQGAPTSGPAATGDFTRFTTGPLSSESPWGECSSALQSDLNIARAGSPWGLTPLVDGKDTGDWVRFCQAGLPIPGDH